MATHKLSLCLNGQQWNTKGHMPILEPITSQGDEITLKPIRFPLPVPMVEAASLEALVLQESRVDTCTQLGICSEGGQGILLGRQLVVPIETLFTNKKEPMGESLKTQKGVIILPVNYSVLSQHPSASYYPHILWFGSEKTI